MVRMDPAAAQTVYETLLQASSQDSGVLKPAEQKLKEWETEPGFYTILFVSKHSPSFSLFNFAPVSFILIKCTLNQLSISLKLVSY